MTSLEEKYLKDCKTNYENDLELKLERKEIEVNINKILKNNNLLKIDFREVPSIQSLEKLSKINQIEEINLINTYVNFNTLRDILNLRMIRLLMIWLSED